MIFPTVQNPYLNSGAAGTYLWEAGSASTFISRWAAAGAGLKKTLRNLAVVFALTGIWHDAGWNYLLWGFINGAMVILERVIQNKPFYKKTPNFIKYAFTMMIVMLFWQLFRFQSLKDTVNLLGTIIGINRPENIYYTWQYYFNAQMITFIIIGILGTTVLGSALLKAA